jgi:hypothetical protein
MPSKPCADTELSTAANVSRETFVQAPVRFAPLSAFRFGAAPQPLLLLK